jgi:gliding motility-associated-like protein
MKRTGYILFYFALLINHITSAQYYIVDVVTINETCGNGSVTIHRSGGVEPVYYNWSDGFHGSIREIITAGTYSVNITDMTGHDTTISIEVKKERCPINVSNSFSPNGDDINDVLSISRVQLYPNFKFQVFNRWGQKVHEQNGGTYVPWDGKQFGVNVPDESYYYIFYYDSAISDDVETGSVSILR